MLNFSIKSLSLYNVCSVNSVNFSFSFFLSLSVFISNLKGPDKCPQSQRLGLCRASGWRREADMALSISSADECPPTPNSKTQSREGIAPVWTLLYGVCPVLVGLGLLEYNYNVSVWWYFMYAYLKVIWGFFIWRLLSCIISGKFSYHYSFKNCFSLFSVSEAPIRCECCSF